MTKRDAPDHMAKLPFDLAIHHYTQQARLKAKRATALRWMWEHNIKERRHVFLQRT